MLSVEKTGGTWSQYAPCELEIGVTFYGRIGVFEGYFLKTFTDVVFLDDPSQTWSGGSQVLKVWVQRFCDLSVREVIGG